MIQYMIHLTDAAIDQILSLVTDEEDLGLRIEVVSGGCSGFQYKFSKVDESTADIGDKVIPGADGEALLFIDKASADKLDGATIDYVIDLMSQKFVVTNPTSNACGCGESFTQKIKK